MLQNSIIAEQVVEHIVRSQVKVSHYLLTIQARNAELVKVRNEK